MRQPAPFGKYLLLERINVGGMAEIFLARSRGVGGFKRILAIKKILPTMAEDEEFIAMFIDEARIAAELSHTGIVQIYELGKFEDDYYIAMEFIHGKDLRFIQERLARERQPFDVHMAALTAFKICEALDYAHNKCDPTGRPLGIIHRDISPQNVILSYDGEVKICDFGIAKAANRSQKTQAGVLKGKFGYMSPEQVRGLPLDGRSDIFTVGTLLYEMITLERLFLGESDFSTLEKVRNADVVPPSSYNRDVPEDLEEIVLRSLSKEVEDRYQNAAEMADALQIFMINSKLASARDLSAFMKDSFRSEFGAELRRLEEYREMPEPDGRTDPSDIDSLLAPADDEEDGDPDAKTMIFASSEGGDLDRSVPPPLPAKRKLAEEVPDGPFTADPGNGQLADAKTAIFGAPAEGEITDAKTMIFADPEAMPDGELSEVPTMLPSPRPVLEAPGSEERTHRERRKRKSLAESLFFPLTLVVALLVGYSIFATVRLAQRNDSPAVSALELRSEPAVGVKVELDGVEVSQGTPFVARDITPGDHSMKLSRTGFKDLERTVTVEPGTRLVMEFSLRPLGKEERNPDLKPDAGTPKAPSVGRPRTAGGTTPTMSPDGGQVDGVAVVSGAAADKGGAEAPPPGPDPAKEQVELLIESSPTGATLLLDGAQAGKTPHRTKVKPGASVQVYLLRTGYNSVRKTIKIEPGRTNKVRLTLTRRPGRTVRSQPKSEHGYLLANTRPWSKVYVDGKYTGRETPIPPDKKLKLSVGKHKVTFEIPGGKRYNFDIEVQQNKTIKLIKRLE